MSHPHDGVECQGHSQPPPTHSHSHSHDGVPCTGHGQPDLSPQEIAARKAEKASYDGVVQSFYKYESFSLLANQRRLKDLLSLPEKDQGLLLGYRKKISAVDDAIRVNADFLREVADETAGAGIFGDEEDDEEEPVVEDDPYADYDDEDLEDYYDDLDSTSPGPPSTHGGHSHSHSHSHGGSHSHAAPSSSVTKPSSQSQDAAGPKPKVDMDKMRSTLKQLVRDWSADGKAERDATYGPIIAALNEHFKDVKGVARRDIDVLTPGAGLGRLSWDICQQGFASQGNEFSFFMLLSSFYLLNRTKEINSHIIHPYIHSFSNHPSNSSLLRPVRLPDVDPSSLPEGSRFSLIAGDFCEVYGSGDEDGKWDAVVTCFFIDTAKNIVEYLRILHRILKKGGLWVNLGPLLWHFENNSTNDPSVELSLDEVKQLCDDIGFDLKNERTIPTTYTSNAEGMLRYEYQAEFWTATKR